MRTIKIYTMQKNESDILEEWILYHSKITDISNIYIIDNISTDKSIDILLKYKNKGLNIYTENYTDYKKKGLYILQLIKHTSSNNDIVIPLDIDEFIGYIDIDNVENLNEFEIDFCKRCINLNEIYYKNIYYVNFKNRTEYIHHYITEIFNTKLDKNTYNTKIIKQYNFKQKIMNEYSYLLGYLNPNKYISYDTKKISEYLKNIPIHDRYSFCYYFTSINTKPYYQYPIKEINKFQLENIHGHNKKFFTSDKILDLDHGNHYGKTKNNEDTLLTSLFLFHYHFRGYIKLVDKCINDIKGLNIIKDINNTKMLEIACKNKIVGSHNIKEYLKFIENGIYQLNNESKNKIIYNSPMNIKLIF